MARPRQKQHSRSVAPTQIWEENVRRSPVGHQRFNRLEGCNVVTTSMAGKFVPLKAFGLLREDGVMNSRIQINVQMSETVKMLLNPVRVSVMAYFIPKLAIGGRYSDMGQIDRSYNGQPEVDGSIIPWFEEETRDITTLEFYKVLGLHKSTGGPINMDYIKAYNTLWNYIAEQRSPSLAPRGMSNAGLAPAFWEHTQLKHVKPTFDDAMLEGEVPLTITEQNIPVKTGTTTNQILSILDGNDTRIQMDSSTSVVNAGAPGGEEIAGLFAELEENGVTVSLANIDLARQTSAWARMRTQYQGISEDWMIDQLMQGIRIRDEALKHPILIDHQQAVIGMTQRYATDGANLDQSVTDGRTMVGLNIRVPQTTCGGVVMVCAQALPEQVYERQQDYYFSAMDVQDDLPNRQADELDPQPVVMVTNREVDTSHSDPDGLFGYAPLNHGWNNLSPRLGGRYWKQTAAEAPTEDRNRIWTPDTVDPTLGTDFYLSSNLPHDVFADATADPFEFWVNGTAVVNGLTYFGPALREAIGDYDHIMSGIDKTRLVGDGTDDPAATAEND